MNSRTSGFFKCNSAAIALLSSVVLVSSGASAKDRKAKGADNPARAVAHISFTGLSSVDMAIHYKGDGKAYLYVQHSRLQGISIIDISKPAEPKALAVVPWPDAAVESRMNVTGDLAIVAETGSPHSASNSDLVLWDLSNPASPRVVQKFSGVVKWLQDERNFIYVLNDDGLWVVSKPADRQQRETSDNYGG